MDRQVLIFDIYHTYSITCMNGYILLTKKYASFNLFAFKENTYKLADFISIIPFYDVDGIATS